MSLLVAGIGGLRPQIEYYLLETGLASDTTPLGESDRSHEVFPVFDSFGFESVELQTRSLPCLLWPETTEDHILSDLIGY